MNSQVFDISCNIKPYIKPFERSLAIRELESLTGMNLIESGNTFTIKTQTDPKYLAERLAYWELLLDNGTMTSLTPDQIRREATTQFAKGSIRPNQISQHLPFNGNVPSVNRRNLRYGPHGIHEYRGKFFPQLVRSLINISGIKQGATVLDPMCGSGTSIVESSLLGFNSFGIDMNPLSVFISETKTSLLSLSPQILAKEYDKLNDLKDSHSESNFWFSKLSESDKTYLNNWFDKNFLAQLDWLISQIESVKNGIVKNYFLVVLSNILREVSWQKTADLRVRKEIKEFDTDVIETYFSELERSFKYVYSFLLETKGKPVGSHKIWEGDSKKAHTLIKSQVDCIITSPPYATALPYLDTDRLSLSFLNLLPRKLHRQKDLEMIGNREISKKQKFEYWSYYESNKKSLSKNIVNLIDRIHHLNENADVGFRRKNLSALLSKYFFDMQLCMHSMKKVLKENAYAFVVVGNNHTIAGGERIDILTDDLIGELSETVGLKFIEKIDMDMLISRDIFKENTGNQESILVLKKA